MPVIQGYQPVCVVSGFSTVLELRHCSQAPACVLGNGSIRIFEVNAAVPWVKQQLPIPSKPVVIIVALARYLSVVRVDLHSADPVVRVSPHGNHQGVFGVQARGALLMLSAGAFAVLDVLMDTILEPMLNEN